jgi:hypothetical protein
MLAFAGICRGMGWVFHRSQRSVDIGIPIFMDGLHDKPTSSKMTMIFFQINCRSKSQYPPPDMDRFFTPRPEEASDRRPYIVFVLNLRENRQVKPSTREANNERGCADDLSKSPAEAQPPKIKIRGNPLKGGEDLPVHPKYTVSVDGCSSTVYNVLEESQHELCDEILRFCDMPEHRRTGTIFQNAVRRMKPYWDPDVSFSWIEWFDGPGVEKIKDGSHKISSLPDSTYAQFSAKASGMYTRPGIQVRVHGYRRVDGVVRRFLLQRLGCRDRGREKHSLQMAGI